MAVYIVFTREKTTDQSQLDTYMREVPSTMSGHPIKILAAYGKQEVLEGPEVEGVVVVEFPTFEAAKAWYDSPAYQHARAHRFAGSDYRAVIVQGV